MAAVPQSLRAGARRASPPRPAGSERALRPLWARALALTRQRLGLASLGLAGWGWAAEVRGAEPEPPLPRLPSEESLSATWAKKVKMATISCPECDQQVGAGSRAPNTRASGAGARWQAAVARGRWLWRGRLAGIPVAEWVGQPSGSVATAGAPNRPGRAEGLPGKRPEPRPGRCPPDGGQTGECLALWLGCVRGGVGLSWADGATCPEPPRVAFPAPVTAAGVWGSGPSGRERSLSALLSRRECLMCKLPSQGSWLPNPPPASQGCFVSISDVYGGPPNCPPATWADS